MGTSGSAAKECFSVNGTNSTDCPSDHQVFQVMTQPCSEFELVVSLILVGITCGLGLMGNVLSILTLRRDTMKSVTTFLLTVLAVADICFILPAIAVIIVPTYCQYFLHCSHSFRSVLVQVEQFGWVVSSFGHSFTIYITMLVTIHRYYYVCRPHDCHRLSGIRRVRWHVAMVPVGAVLFNLPRIFEHQVKWAKFGEDRKMFETVKYFTAFGKSTAYSIVYKIVLFYLVMFIIPLTVLITLSIRLAHALHQRRHRYRGQQASRNQNRRDDNITFVLIVIIAVFLLCQTPMLAHRLVLTISGNIGYKCGQLAFYLEQIAEFMLLVNSSANFVIYVLFARRFRRTLMRDVLGCTCSFWKTCEGTVISDKALKEVPAGGLSGVLSSRKTSKKSNSKTSSSKSTATQEEPQKFVMKPLRTPRDDDRGVCNGNACTTTSLMMDSPFSSHISATDPEKQTSTNLPPTQNENVQVEQQMTSRVAISCDVDGVEHVVGDSETDNLLMSNHDNANSRYEASTSGRPLDDVPKSCPKPPIALDGLEGHRKDGFEQSQSAKYQGRLLSDGGQSDLESPPDIDSMLLADTAALHASV